MRRFGRVLAAAALAAGGFASVLTAGTPASATGTGSAGGGYDIVLVDLSGNEVPIFVNISPTLTANLCGVDISVINALVTDKDRANCPNQGRYAKAKKH